MDRAVVRKAICEVIGDIQEVLGRTRSELDDQTKPGRDLEGFDSKTWPVAIGMLEDKIGIEIPIDENLFYDIQEKEYRTIDECIKVTLSLTEEKNKKRK